VAKSPPPKRNSAKTTSRGSVKTAGARPTKVQAGRPAGLFTWLAVGLVVLVVAVLVIIKVVGGSSATGNASFQAADATTVAQLTQLPGTIFDTVGVKSSVVTVTPPIVLKSQPTLTGTSSAGVKLPEVFYFGAEYCPFCAAERWSTIVALSGIGLATFFFLKSRETARSVAEQFSGVYRLLSRKYYVDEIYDAGIVQPIRIISKDALWRGLDVRVIDGAVNGIATAARGTGGGLRRLQTGLVRNYALGIALGTVLLLLYVATRVTF